MLCTRAAADSFNSRDATTRHVSAQAQRRVSVVIVIVIVVVVKVTVRVVFVLIRLITADWATLASHCVLLFSPPTPVV